MTIVVAGGSVPGSDEILTPEALAFVEALERAFEPRRRALLKARAERRAALAAGGTLDLLPETAGVRASDWSVAAAPADLDDRRVEITGPAEPKMMINALNSGARVFMADLEDALSPTWANVVGGQLALRAAVRRELDVRRPGVREGVPARGANGHAAHPAARLAPRRARICSSTARRSVPAWSTSGCGSSTTRLETLSHGSGPYLYLPKLEHHLEARLWNEVFVAAQEALGVPRGSVRATVLIETLPAAFQMDEILRELREHSAGLNAGRWDYLFSLIKNLRARPEVDLPDRAQLTMTVPFMRSYTRADWSGPATAAAPTRSAAWRRSSRRAATPR